MTRNIDRARRIHDAIRSALLNEWDPIGVNGIPEAADEYDSYVSSLYKLLITRRDKAALFDYLWWLETEHMGLTGDRQATQLFTERLMHIYDEVDQESSAGSPRP
jgi:hypothetical protein